MHKYSEEAKQRYGHTEAYKESIKRTSKLSKDELQEIALVGDEILVNISQLMDKLLSDIHVQSLVHEYRLFISKYYYDCTTDIYRGLGKMYLEDARFEENIDKHGNGLTVFLSSAIKYYCNNK